MILMLKILLILRQTHKFSIKKLLFQALNNLSYSSTAVDKVVKKSSTPTNSKTIGIKL